MKLITSGHRPTSLFKMLLFHRCFSNILLVKTNNLVFCKWNISQKWVNKNIREKLMVEFVKVSSDDGFLLN